MGLSLRGTTSGAIDINAPAVAGDNTITLPGNNGSANQFFKNSGTAGIVTFSSMVETPAGLVGIGTDNPTDTGGYGQALDITGGASGAAVYLRTANGDTGEIAFGSALTIRTRQVDPILFNTNNSERVRITSGGFVGINTTTPNYILQISKDNLNTVQLETADDTSYGRILFEQSGVNGRAKYIIGYNQNSADFGDHLALKNQQGDIGFYAGGLLLADERLRITSAGLVRVTDSATLSFGNGDDMRIFHDGGSANYIDVYNKDLYIRCNRDAGITGGDIILQPKSGESSAIFRDDGAVELYYDNSKKLETVSSGVKVTNRIFLGNSTNGGFDYNSSADTLEVLTTNGGTHSEWNSSAYVPSSNGGKNLGHHNKRWDNVFCNGVRFGGDNSDATTLDDYEEGTFTCAVNFGGNNTGMTFNEQTGFYTKIGRFVFCTFVYQITNKGSATGDAVLTGLPFATMNDVNARGGGGFTYAIGFTSLRQLPILYSVSNSTFVYIYEVNSSSGGGTGSASLTNSNFSNGSQWRAYFSYYTDS